MNKDFKQIKCLNNIIKPDEYYLHPITLEFAKNTSTNKICPTGFHYKNGVLLTLIRTKFNPNLSEKDIQSYMALPYLNLSLEHMLNIYNIKLDENVSIDSLIIQIDKMIQSKTSFQTINRIINVWIKYNFRELKENNNFLVSIYKKLGSKLNNEALTKIINEWFNKHDMNDFHLNLGEHIFKKTKSI